MAENIFESDVAVIGGGNAGLCAALSAAEAGASVLLLESAPAEFRGGNSRHTRNMRTMHERPMGALTGSYPEEEYFQDLLRVTGGHTDQNLARMVIRETSPSADWMVQHGVRFQPALGGTLSLARTNAFFLGGGKALLNSYYHAAAKRRVRVVYNAEVTELHIRDGVFESGIAMVNGVPAVFRTRALVAAAGGFEANLEWLQQAWGPAAQNFLVRGTPYNRGTVLRLLLDRGAEPVGDPTQCHAVAIDGRAPKFDGGIVTRLDCVPLGIAVNQHAERFYDEGEDLWPKRYAIWGRLVAQQPGQIAFSIIDSKTMGKFMPSVFPPFKSESIAGLAAALGLPPDKLACTIANYNRSVLPGKFDPQSLDDCHTTGLTPPKSHWALPIDTPPFFGYPLRPGITFTYLGVKVNERAAVKGIRNVFAAGEIMAGNVLGKGYLAGFGMAIGTVFGRIAGREAARGVR
ncbi:MAG TPA: FAD-dependent tricarballylate dehydrogenase TcuA [Bryobacteraceae bacterium]|nr:FAD-dependent tricarballylate dehydrogenase TcuA [Bryobacteraceae bacterium]